MVRWMIAAAAAAWLSTLGACMEQEPVDPRWAASGGDAARGRRLLSHYQCGSCHAIPDVPSAQGRVGPPLDAFGKRVYIAGELPNDPATLQRWLQDPQALVPGTVMPDMGVPPSDARDMAAYLHSLK
jgi:cytochrome c2